MPILPTWDFDTKSSGADRADANQHFTRRGPRHRQIVTPDKFVEPSVPDKNHAFHCSGKRHVWLRELVELTECTGWAKSASTVG